MVGDGVPIESMMGAGGDPVAEPDSYSHVQPPTARTKEKKSEWHGGTFGVVISSRRQLAPARCRSDFRVKEKILDG